MLTIIVAADNDNAIGKDNNLLAHIPADMKFYRETTTGHAIVMGSRTYMGFPKRPLPNRENLVITHNPENYPEVRTFGGIEEFLSFAKDYEGEIFVCGGGTVYKALFPYCEKALITRVDYRFGGDTFIPDIDSMPEWKKTAESETIESNGYNIRFMTYENTAPLSF